MTMKAEIIAVGSELLTPDKIDTNSLFLTEELNKLGIEIVRKTVVGDDRALLMEAFRDAVNRVPLIISSGGLGPTEDDLTRETVAELLGRKLVRCDPIVRAIEARFRSFGRPMPEANLRQAMVPEGSEPTAAFRLLPVRSGIAWPSDAGEGDWVPWSVAGQLSSSLTTPKSSLLPLLTAVPAAGVWKQTFQSRSKIW